MVETSASQRTASISNSEPILRINNKSGVFATPLASFATIHPPSPQIHRPIATPGIPTPLAGQKRKSVEVEVPEDFCSISVEATPIWPSAENSWFPAAKVRHETMASVAVASEGVSLSVPVRLASVFDHPLALLCVDFWRIQFLMFASVFCYARNLPELTAKVTTLTKEKEDAEERCHHWLDQLKLEQEEVQRLKEEVKKSC